MATTAATPVVLFDDQCPLCVSQMRTLSRLDWFSRLTLMPISHPQALQLAPGLTHEALIEAIHCVTPAGRVYRGARSLRFVGMRLPLLVPLALALWLPGAIQAAEWVYGRVARNRLLLSRFFGCKTACSGASAPPKSHDGPGDTPTQNR